MSAIATPRVGTDTSTVTDDGSGFDSGWYCIRTAPWPCPREGCGFVAEFVTGGHVIIVWPRIDDRWLLTVARNCRELNRDPHVVEYEPGFGQAIAFDAWRAAGRPVHGRADRPSPHWNPNKL